MLDYLKKFKNTGTIIGLVGLIGSLLIQFGVKVDITWLNNTINIVCSILVVLGIANNPTTTGIDLPITKTATVVEEVVEPVVVEDTNTDEKIVE